MFDIIDGKRLRTPTLFKDNITHMKLSDRYIKIYRVAAFPDEFTFGLLDIALNGKMAKYYYKSKPCKDDMGKAITKELNSLKHKYRKEKDQLLKERIAKNIEELQGLINDLVASHNFVLDVMMIICIYGLSKQEMEENAKDIVASLTTQYRFKLVPCDYRQEEFFKELIPFWKDSGLLKDQKYDYAIPLTARSFAGLWPFYYEEVRDYKGSIIGHEQNKGGIIKWNPFLWLDDKKTAYEKGITAGNVFICGESGSGKTTIENKIFRNLIKDKIKTIWVDPENKNAKIVKKYGGNYIYFGADNNIINVLGLKRIGSDEDVDFVNPYDTKLAINNCIRDFKQILKLYHSALAAEVNEACNVIDEIILKTYEEKGITAEDFRIYKESDYPIISDVVNQLHKEIEKRKADEIIDDYILTLYIKLDSYLKPFVNGEAGYFDGHTNIYFDNNTYLLGFGTKMLNNASDELSNSVFYLLMQYASSFAYDNSGNKNAIIWDEVHKYALKGFCLPILSDLARRVRKYNCINVIATQEPADLASDVMVKGASVKSYGKAIFNNTTYYFIMKLKKNGVKTLASMITLNEVECERIEELTIGEAIFIKGKDHYMINIDISEGEKGEI